MSDVSDVDWAGDSEDKTWCHLSVHSNRTLHNDVEEEIRSQICDKK